MLVNNKKIIEPLLKECNNVSLIRLRSKPLSLMEQFEIPFFCRNSKIDIFHSPSFVIPRFMKTKVVVTIHDLIHVLFKSEFSFIVQLYYKLIVRPAIRNSNIVITDSKSSESDIVDWANIDGSRIRVVSLACDSIFKKHSDNNAMQAVRSKYGVDGKYIMYNGNKKAHKNVEALIEAFAILKSRLKEPCTLVVVGKRDNNTTETNCAGIDSLIAKRKLSDSVVFTGHVSEYDLVGLYNSAQLLVMPSLYEGFGFPVLEAMQCGCPVVCSNISSLPNVCDDAAFYIDPYSIESIAEGLHRVFTDEDLRRELADKGLERAKAFSWDKCANETLNIYNEVYCL